MLTLPYNRSRSSQGHDLYKLCRAPVTDASHQVSKSVFLFSFLGMGAGPLQLGKITCEMPKLGKSRRVKFFK